MPSVEERRELRRRKILENSASRLKRITNVKDNEESIEENNSSSLPSFILPQKTFTSSSINSISNKPSVATNTNFTTIYQNPMQNVEDNQSESQLEFTNLINKKSNLRIWMIIIIALLARYLLLLGDQYVNIFSRYRFNKIFVPFLAYEIAEFILYKPSESQVGLLKMLLFMNTGFHTEHIRKFITYLQIFGRIFQDMMIYSFAFICLDQVILYILHE